MDDRPRTPTRTSLADGVYEVLMAQLMDGELRPEQQLNIDGLAKSLAVSQTPIREALARLESTGLVRREALRGYRVAPLYTDRELDDLMDARAVVEPSSTYFATTRMPDAALDPLAASIDALRTIPHGPHHHDVRAYWRADEQFHDLIVRGADNVFLLSAYRSFGGTVQRFRLFSERGVTDADAAVHEHSAVLEAMRRRDADGARDAMRRHILAVKARARQDRDALR
ncbi:GntR family transcriptional regulator [Curtobacterium sp. MCBD17_013]|uniref:GntR family transcriptional regulator n=1 Tax=Curtobacterium sp. MCBD17_013 TaxID=2175668 RepID=UPI000DA9E9BA|nr:GntR family transcriptional regulator [Curtobacterium sp. MCBD17_013]PZF59078.1 GntR family transcriptional regulator [Curtobacterium sp. MCBD17_013]